MCPMFHVPISSHLSLFCIILFISSMSYIPVFEGVINTDRLYAMYYIDKTELCYTNIKIVGQCFSLCSLKMALNLKPEQVSLQSYCLQIPVIFISPNLCISV